MHKAPGKELIDAYCTTCHSTSYITAQPPFPEAIWRSEVNKMIHTYGAIIPKETAEKIIAYLAKHYSPQNIAHTYAQIAAAKRTKTTPAPKAPSSKAPPAWMAQAQTLYAQKCTACHQANGAGLPGAFPPLAGHAQRFTATPALRSYVIRAVLYGLQGHIKVNGKDYFSMMPPLPPTSDKELALILNYVTHAWGNQARQTAPAPQFTAQEIKAQRGLSLTPLQVHGARKALGL
jgi:mono/diheme cytochrome c family protein